MATVDVETRASLAPSPVLWDVVERHFGDAEFLFEQWESALYSPTYRLAKWAATVERRLLAHLDGLRIGGPVVAERLLAPVLLDPEEPARATVAALALLSTGDDSMHVVFDALEAADDSQQPALARALVLSEESRIDAWLLKRLEKTHDESKEALYLEILTGRGTNPEELLRPYLDTACPRLTMAVLEAIRRFAHHKLSLLADKFFQSTIPALRASAIKTGLTFGSRAAWKACLEVAQSTVQAEPDLFALVAMLGAPEDHTLLYKPFGTPALAESALWALGFAGTLEAGEACLKFLNGKNLRAAKMAADSLSWIGGFDLYADEFHLRNVEPSADETLPPFEEENLDADLVPDGVDELPVPNAPAITQWWRAHRRHLSLPPRRTMETLRTAPLWRRHALAMELSIRSGGAQQVSTQRFSARQKREMR